jgi:xylulose-5-phosphate/fructose-6-phosphate phosphoketolase
VILPFRSTIFIGLHTDRHNIHVRGSREKGKIKTPLELNRQTPTGRFSLAIDIIVRIPRLSVTGAEIRELLLNQQIAG